MLAAGGGSCHGFGCPDEVVGRLVVEEVEVLEIVVLWTLEHVERNAESFAGLIYCVEEVEEDLRALLACLTTR